VKYILKRWQDSWDQQINSKLQARSIALASAPKIELADGIRAE
jgi:hypothetical protein